MEGSESRPEDRLPLHLILFVSWGLCELLIRTSCRTAPAQASEAAHLADLAVHAADLIPGAKPFEEQWIYQLRSLAWAGLGNARKIQGDLSGAERCFEMADSWWEAGTAGSEDALGYEPLLLDLKAPLRTAQRRFPEALDSSTSRGSLPQRSNPAPGSAPTRQEPHLETYFLIEMGESESAIPDPEEAKAGSTPNRDPRLVTRLQHNLVDNLSKMGRHTEAAALLPDLRALAAERGSALDRLRLTWVEGRIAAGLGDHDRARCLLTEVRQRFLADGNPYEAALATLDLAVPTWKRVTPPSRALATRCHRLPDPDVSRTLPPPSSRKPPAENRTATLAREVASPSPTSVGIAPAIRAYHGDAGFLV